MRFLKILSAVSVCITFFGCASNPKIDPGTTAQEYSRNMSGHQYSFLMNSVSFSSSVSGEEDPEYGMKGMKVTFTPLIEYCKERGGKLIALEPKIYGDRKLPTRLHCQTDSELFWGVEPNYSN